MAKECAIARPRRGSKPGARAAKRAADACVWGCGADFTARGARTLAKMPAAARSLRPMWTAQEKPKSQAWTPAAAALRREAHGEPNARASHGMSEAVEGRSLRGRPAGKGARCKRAIVSGRGQRLEGNFCDSPHAIFESETLYRA